MANENYGADLQPGAIIQGNALNQAAGFGPAPKAAPKPKHEQIFEAVQDMDSAVAGVIARLDRLIDRIGLPVESNAVAIDRRDEPDLISVLDGVAGDLRGTAGTLTAEAESRISVIEQALFGDIKPPF